LLEICCLGWIVSLCSWQPDPQNIKGDGTQRTVENKCLAGFCAKQQGECPSCGKPADAKDVASCPASRPATVGAEAAKTPIAAKS